MQLDSATTANIGTVATLNPSAAMVTLLLGAGLVYLLSLVLKNGKLTEAIAERLEGGEETMALLKAIREDQIKSNAERKEQGIRITAIEGRLDSQGRELKEHGAQLAAFHAELTALKTGQPPG